MNQPTTTAPVAYTVTEAAAALRIGRSTLYRLIERGDITPVHIGDPDRRGRTVFPRTEIERFLAAGTSPR